MLNEIMLGLGAAAVVLVIVLAIKGGNRDPETSCMGCTMLYRPSNSNARDKELFHSKDCEERWRHWRAS